jgi:hypothetical protein
MEAVLRPVEHCSTMHGNKLKAANYIETECKE